VSVDADLRAGRAEALIRRCGIEGARVEAEGPKGEIAALRVSVEDWAEIAGTGGAAVTEELRAIGFRYVALDLEVLP
jgi:PP-loop superfamily ATP-utilizing enzyme